MLPQVLRQGTWIELQSTLWWSIVELAPSVHLKVDFHCRVIFTSERSYFYGRLKQSLVSLRNRTAQRRGRQNACVWQTWQACYLRVCVDVQSIQLCFDLLQKRRWSLAEIVFTLVTQGLPSSSLCRDSLCVSSQMYMEGHTKNDARPLNSWSSLLKLKVTRTYISYTVLHSLFLFTRVKYAVQHYSGNPPLWREPRCTELMEMT